MWTPRRMSCSVSRPNERSTWLIQDEPVGVKVQVKPWVAGQPVAHGRVLWVARLSQIRCTSSSAGTALSIAIRNLRNSTARCPAVKDRGRASRSWLIHQPVQSAGHDPPAPARHRARSHPQLLAHLLVGQPAGTRQHDLRSQRQRLRRVRPPRPAGLLLPLGVGEHQLGLRPPRTRALDQPVTPSPSEPLAPEPVGAANPVTASDQRLRNRPRHAAAV